jgi:PLP dependent protein
VASIGLSDVQARIKTAAVRAGRDPEAVRLLAVSKGRSNQAVRDLYAAGQRAFGENRPQGLRDRVEAGLPSDIEWHFVGNVQRRAIRVIAPQIVLLHSLDRASLIPAWAKIDRPPPVLIEVNIADEPQKHGFASADVAEIADAVVDAGIALRGLMIIPPRVRRPQDSRPWFAGLRDLGERVRRNHPTAVELSMGMTDDFEVAIEEGASIVRVGRAIFEPANINTSDRSTED